MDKFNSLPLDLKSDILSRLPVETIRDCKPVCKSWRNLLRLPSFSRLLLRRLNHGDNGKLGFLGLSNFNGRRIQEFSYFEYNQNNESTTPVERIRRVNLIAPFEATSIVGSSNGLICLAGCDRPSISICNPITREQFMLPEIKTQYCDTSKYYNWTSGFGYISSTDVYKVVAVHVAEDDFIEVHIYTLGSHNGWRNLGKFNLEFDLEDSLKQGIFANGTLYWMGHFSKIIFTFDLAEERFLENLSPPPLPLTDSNWHLHRIGILDGILYFAAYLVIDGDVTEPWYDIWLFKKKNDNRRMKDPEEHQLLGWTYQFRLEEQQLVAITKSGCFLTHKRDYFNMYDPKVNISKRSVDFKEWMSDIVPHKSTLVSLKELGEEDTGIMESIEIQTTESKDSPWEQPEEVDALDALRLLKESREEETESHDLPLEQQQEDEALDT